MAGNSSVTGNQTITYTDNMCFDGTSRGSPMDTDGQLWIGSTASDRPNDGGHVRLGELTSPLGTLNIGYSAPNITLDVAGGTMAVDSFAMQSGTTPVVPDGTGLVTFNGGIGNAGSNPVQTIGTGATTMELRVQTSQALLAGDSGKIGLSNFDSTDFTVSAAGFVELATTGAGKTITGDDSVALSPVANNWNVFGRSGSKTSGLGATLTVKSPPYADQAAGVTVTLNSGSFATNAITLTTPATAGLADGELVEFVATNGVLVVQMNTGQVGHLGAAVTTSGGTFTGSSTGDSLSLRWQASTSDWWATSAAGVWVLA